MLGKKKERILRSVIFFMVVYDFLFKTERKIIVGTRGYCVDFIGRVGIFE